MSSYNYAQWSVGTSAAVPQPPQPPAPPPATTPDTAAAYAAYAAAYQVLLKFSYVSSVTACFVTFNISKV